MRPVGSERLSKKWNDQFLVTTLIVQVRRGKGVDRMMGRYRYAREKFTDALQSLAMGPGDVRSRLESAYMSIWHLSKDQLPPELQDDFKWILKTLRKHPTRKAFDGTILEGTVQHTTRRMRKRTGVKIAEKIFHIGWTLMTSKEYGVLY